MPTSAGDVLGASNGCVATTRIDTVLRLSPVLRLQLGKGLGHNTYGEAQRSPAWLYMFPICILAIVFSAI